MLLTLKVGYEPIQLNDPAPSEVTLIRSFPHHIVKKCFDILVRGLPNKPDGPHLCYGARTKMIVLGW
jgi:hypothetical protein